jgi:restriction system protein
MSRRGGFLNAVLRAAAAADRQRIAEQRRQATALARAERDRIRNEKLLGLGIRLREREAQRDHIRDQEQDTEFQNAEVQQRIEALSTLLSHALSSPGVFDFGGLKRKPEVRTFVPGQLGVPEPPPQPDPFLPPPLTGLRRLIPGAKRSHEEVTELGSRRYEEALAAHAAWEEGRERSLAQARLEHERGRDEAQREADDWNAQVDQFAREYQEGKPRAVTDYFRLVLDRSEYPEGFPKIAKTAYVPESKQLVVEYDLPTIDVIPEAGGYKYVKSKDEIVATPRPAGQRRALYSSVVAQVTLRSLHELFSADTRHVGSIVFNGYVDSIDKGTGKAVRPCLVTVRTTRETFAELNLAHVEPNACLKTLNASVSPSPLELVPIRPVLEFRMVDPRFVEEIEVLSTLDQRPNLMELSPTEFESLITNLFVKMGLETRLTQASRDGGVDCVAYDPRPIFGGKVIIQAKRYKHTVGVSAVRDLFGTLQNEGASKGILVTTSGYGKASFEFAEGKPLELLSGSHLLYLLEQHAGVKAKIEVPDNWKDPAPDAGEAAVGQSTDAAPRSAADPAEDPSEDL